jgi:hypothetical protein
MLKIDLFISSAIYVIVTLYVYTWSWVHGGARSETIGFDIIFGEWRADCLWFRGGLTGGTLLVRARVSSHINDNNRRFTWNDVKNSIKLAGSYTRWTRRFVSRENLFLGTPE